MPPDPSDINTVQASLEGLEKNVGINLNNLSERVFELKGDLCTQMSDLKLDLKEDIKSLKEDLEKRHSIDFAAIRKDFHYCKIACEDGATKLKEEDSELKSSLTELSLDLEGIKGSRKTWNIIWSLMLTLLLILVGVVGLVGFNSSTLH